MTNQPSGVDMARAALAAARAAANTRPAQPDRKRTTRSRRETRTSGRDPLALSAAINGLLTDRGWEPPEAGGSILDQWPAIAPELVDKVAAVRYEHDTGVLHLLPASDAYATQLRMFQRQMLGRIAEKTGGRSVRALRILPPGPAPAGRQDDLEAIAPAPAVEAPVRTRETASPGYQAALEAAVAHRPERPPTDPYLAAAMARQETALRAHRQPESEHREAVWAQADAEAAPATGSMAASERAALAFARREKAGHSPRRVFDTA